MSSPVLAGVNLNLLRVFDAIYSARSLTKAAHQLGLTQPATSHALKRLRAQTGDELFVRSPTGMVPTQRADELSTPIAAALRTLENALQPPQDFDPRTEPRTFSLGISDHASIVLLPLLVPAITAEAPGVSLRVTHLPTPSPTDLDPPTDLYGQLDAGDIDIAITLATDHPRHYESQLLYSETDVCVCAASNPLVGDQMSAEAYIAARHVRIPLGSEVSTPIDDWFAKRRVSRKVAVTLSDLAVALRLVAETDMIATVPRHSARALAPPGKLRFLEPVVPFVEPGVAQIWHRRHTRDPAHVWLRSAINAAAAGVGEAGKT